MLEIIMFSRENYILQFNIPKLQQYSLMKKWRRINTVISSITSDINKLGLVDIDWNTMATCSNFYFLTAFYMLNTKRIIKFMISDWDLLLLVYYLLRVECNIHMQTTNLHLKKQHGMWEISTRRWINSIVTGWNDWNRFVSTTYLQKN